MQPRKVILVSNETYHVYNRSIAKEQIFSSRFQLTHIYEAINYYRYSQTLRFSEFRKLTAETKQQYITRIEQKQPLIEIYAFAFMPNHYHFLLKQTQDDGIKQFISILQNSYAKYFNMKIDRQGSLFQSPFKAKWIETDEQLVHVSRYIHLNPVTAYIIPIEELEMYPFTSFPNYLNANSTSWVNTDAVAHLFPSRKDYKEFVEDQSDYQKSIAEDKDIFID